MYVRCISLRRNIHTHLSQRNPNTDVFCAYDNGLLRVDSDVIFMARPNAAFQDIRTKFILHQRFFLIGTNMPFYWPESFPRIQNLAAPWYQGLHISFDQPVLSETGFQFTAMDRSNT